MEDEVKNTAYGECEECGALVNSKYLREKYLGTLKKKMCRHCVMFFFES